MKWIKLTMEIPDHDFVGMIKLEGKKFCFVKHQGKIFVVQHSCPHAGGSLSGGWCKDGHLICPIHRYEYELETGRGASGQGDYIDRYPVEQREDGLYVGLKQSIWQRFFKSK